MYITNIVLDMDGTLAGLYTIPHWLEYLTEEKTLPYEEAKPLVDMAELAEVLTNCMDFGIKIHIVTWSAKNASPEYNARIRKAKLEWLKRYGIPFDTFHLQKYGTCKRKPLYNKINDETLTLLIDDNNKICTDWVKSKKYPSIAVNPTVTDMIDFLKNLIE